MYGNVLFSLLGNKFCFNFKISLPINKISFVSFEKNFRLIRLCSFT